MAAGSLLTLLDDIATLLDDVAILSKLAAKKTTGIIGDDLALNAEQVSGVKANRELPVVWAVAKGSLLNKLILVPAALLISAFFPPLITVLLVIGGLYLCYEGVEKITHKYLHKNEVATEHRQKLAALADPNADLVAFEKEKIKGAIRTDFVLSAEIIVIVLGTVKDAAFASQVMVVSVLAVLITIGVYGLVAAIVKIDDLGLYLLRKSLSGAFNALQRSLGRGLLMLAPLLMKTLSVVGTAAMFLVGGGILVHSMGSIHHQFASLQQWINATAFSSFSTVFSLLADGLLGVVAGGLVLLSVTFSRKFIKPKP